MAPVWTRNGRELIYLDGAHHLTAVAVDTTESAVRTARPATLVTTTYAAPGPGARTTCRQTVSDFW